MGAFCFPYHSVLVIVVSLHFNYYTIYFQYRMLATFPIVAPSILAADFLHLGDAVNMLNKSLADWIHVDVMDGRFVPNISFGFPVMEALKQIAQKPLDVHLMIVEPERYIESFIQAGAAIVSIHYEASPHLHRSVHHIKQLGAKAGVAINPHTPIAVLEDIIADIDLVCMMSVNPGFGGQHFIENTYHKIQQLRNLIAQKKSAALIEIDGGVSEKNAAALIACGANVLVAGSSVFRAANPSAQIAELKNITAKPTAPISV